MCVQLFGSSIELILVLVGLDSSDAGCDEREDSLCSEADRSRS